MPSTTPRLHDSGRPRHDRLARLGGPSGRRAAYERGELSVSELFAWARQYPDEPPIVNGEYAWIGLRMADLD